MIPTNKRSRLTRQTVCWFPYEAKHLPVVGNDYVIVSVRASGLASDQIANDLVQTGAKIGAELIGIAATAGATAYVIKRRREMR